MESTTQAIVGLFNATTGGLAVPTAIIATFVLVAIGYSIGASSKRARKTRRDSDDGAQYQRVLRTLPYTTKRVMNKSEVSLYRSAVALAKQNNWIVLAQVRLAEFVQLDSDHEYNASKDNQRAWREISQKHVDILLVDKATLLPVAAIECDGPFHITDAATKRNDCFKDALAIKIGVPLVRLQAGSKLKDADYVKRSLITAGVDVR